MAETPLCDVCQGSGRVSELDPPWSCGACGGRGTKTVEGICPAPKCDKTYPHLHTKRDTPVDPTNPAHYTSHPSGVECITITRHFNFNRGNAIKYIWRAGEKGASKTIEDLRKAAWYIQDEIKRLEGK